MNFVIVTYPRSGSHLLRDHIDQKLNAQYSYTHSCIIKKNIPFVTIIRDPKECIASWASMELHYEDMAQTRNNQNIEFYIEAAKMKFITFYTYALKNIDIFFEYNSLVKDPSLAIKYLSDNLDITYKSNDYTNNIIDVIKQRHIVSSTKSRHYEIVKEAVNNYPLKECYDFYYQALNKCVNMVE